MNRKGKERKGTYIVNDVYDESNKLYVDKDSAIQLADIEQAKLIVNNEKPPWWLDAAVKSTGSSIPQPQVGLVITFNKYGKEKITQITANNIGKRLALFIDNKLVIAPVIIEKMDSKEVQITSSFTKEEAQAMVDRINNAIKKLNLK